MDNPLKMSKGIVAFLQILGTTLVYYWVAGWGLSFAWQHSNVSAIWPASAIGIIVVILFGRRFAWGIWLGAFFINLSYYLSSISFTFWQALGSSTIIATGNTLEALLIFYLLKKLIGDNNPLYRVQHFFRYMGAVMIGCAVSATIGSLIVCQSSQGVWASFATIWFTWWMGDYGGIMTLTPVFWLIKDYIRTRQLPRRIFEFFICLGVLLTFNSMLFDGASLISKSHLPITYISFALMLLLTYRFGYWGAISSILVTTYQDIQGTYNGYGPFVSIDLNSSILQLQTFMVITEGTCLLLAAALHERLIAQQKVNLSEKRFRSLVENNQDIILLMDAQANITYCSPSIYKVLGYTPQEHVGHNIFEFIHSDDEARIKQELGNVLKNPGKIVTAMARLRHKNGTWRWVEGSGQNQLDDPATGGIVTNYRDITERKLAQERFEGVIELAPNAMIMVNNIGEVFLANQAAETLFGYTRSELLALKQSDLIFEAALDNSESQKKGMYSTARLPLIASGTETYALKKDESQVPVEVAFSSMETDKGMCLIISIVDITQRKLVENILKTELKQASRLADLGTLAAIVAHELRTPLGVIQMAAHNLKNKYKDLMVDKHVENIQKKVWEGNRIIDNLLIYSRLKTPTFKPCAILALLDECIESFQTQFKTQMQFKIEKHYEVPSDITIDADINQIREVLINLISNSHQALNEGVGQIDITVQSYEGTHVEIIIADNGCGIEKDDLEKIFQPFFTTKAKGTGLGLPICNELINLHHGRMDIQSVRGSGTQAHVILPIQTTHKGEK